MADLTNAAPGGAPESSAQAEPSTGQAVGTGQAAEPFFSYSRYDGTKDEFASKDELAKAWRDSYLRQQDYTKKTQSHAEERKKYEAERKAFEDERKQFQERAKQYQAWDRQLKARPDLERQLAALAGQGPVNHEGIGNLVDERTKELAAKIEAMEKRDQERESALQTQKAYESVQAELGEWFNKDAVDEMMQAVDGNDPVAIIRLAALAAIGRNSMSGPGPVQPQASAAIKQEKGKARLVSSGSVPQPKDFKDTRDAHQAAMREYAGVNGPRG